MQSAQKNPVTSHYAGEINVTKFISRDVGPNLQAELFTALISRLCSLGVSPRPPVPTPGACPSGYRYVEVQFGADDFCVYLGYSGEDADEVLTGSTRGGLTLEGRRLAEHLTVTRTFYPPDNFNLLFVGLVVHGPPSVTIIVDGAEDTHRETVGSLSLSLSF